MIVISATVCVDSARTFSVLSVGPLLLSDGNHFYPAGLLSSQETGFGGDLKRTGDYVVSNAPRLPRKRVAQAPRGHSFRLGSISRALIAVAISGSLLVGLTPAVAQPVNPDDAAIADAQESVESGSGEVSRLAGSLSQADAEINRLELEMGALREAVNKALVDLHDAQSEAERARQNAAAAKAELEESQRQIEAAQERLDEISRAAYRQNGASRGIAGVSGNGVTEDALDRQTYLRTTAQKQREAVEELDRLRTENANKESALREARVLAEQREAEAAEKELQTRAAIDENSAQLAVLTTNRTNLVAEREEAERNLALARANVDTLQAQRAEFEEFQRAEEERQRAEADAAARQEEKRRADEAAAAAAEAAAVAEAAERAAAQEVAEAQAAAEEAQVAPGATGPTGPTEPTGPAEATAQAGPQVDPQAAVPAQATEQADEQVQEQADTQRQAEEARRVAEEAQAAAQAAAADEAQAQQLRDQALTAASVAAAALIAASQAEHATTDNPYPSGEDAEAGTIAAIQGPEIPAEVPAGGDELWAEGDYVELEEPESGSLDLSDVTESASELVTGDRAAQIETVIARAMAQIGTPYAWGGGNASGPTLGIRDGGVADSYGDYNKVGFDCSGLVLYAFAGVGVALPHYTGYQYQRGTKVSPSEMQRGDLIFYGPGASQHVAIYLGDGQMIEAPSSGSTVQVSPVRWSGMTEYAVRLI